MADDLMPDDTFAEGADVPAEDAAPVVDVPGLDEPAPDPAAPVAADEPVAEPAHVLQARENAALRQYVTMLEQQVRQGQQAPPPPPPQPDFWAHMTPEQKQAWTASYKELEPVLRFREQQLLAQMEQRFRQSDTRGEVAEMRAEYGDDFRAKEGQLVQLRQQIAQQGGGWLSLGDLYLHMKGQEAIQAARTQRNQATQQRRKGAAVAARPIGQAPAGVRTPPPPMSALSDEEFMNQMAKQTGIPRMTFKKRA